MANGGGYGGMPAGAWGETSPPMPPKRPQDPNAPSSNTAPVSAVTPTIARLPNLNVPTTGALQSQAEMGQEMMEAGIDTSPVRSWTQGMARVANAVFGGQMMRDAYQREMDLYNKGASDAARLVGGGGGTSGGAGATGNYVSEGPHQTGSVDTANMDPVFLGRANQLISDAAAAGIPAHIVSGYRDYDTQAKLYANYQARLAGQTIPYPQLGNGGLAAKPGMSMHNVGRAFDAVANDPKQQPALIALARQPWRGFRVGADFGDNDHFEAAEGRTAPLAPYRQTLASQ
jgi:hypothetical protein